MDSPLDQERAANSAGSSPPGETVAAGAPPATTPAVKPTLPPAAKSVAKPAVAVVEHTQPAVKDASADCLVNVASF